MVTSRLNSPRFALPYTHADFMAGALAIIRGGPLPEAFGLLGASPKFWTRSGRQALRLLLEALNLTPGSGVALPLFTDPSLVGAIVAAGHRPIFIDIDQRYLTMDPKSLDAARGAFRGSCVACLGKWRTCPSPGGRGDRLMKMQPMRRSVSWTDDWAVLGRPALQLCLRKYWPWAAAARRRDDLRISPTRWPRRLRSLRPPHVEELRHLVLQAAAAVLPPLQDLRKADATMGRIGRFWNPTWICRRSAMYAAVASRQAAPSAEWLGSEPTACSFCRGSAPWRRSFFPSNGPEPVTTTICSRCCSGTATNARR